MVFYNIQKSLIAVVLIALHLLFVFGDGYAAPFVRLVVDPDSTEVYAGSDPITINAEASGSDLRFNWELVGPGKIEGTGASIFYIVPDMIEKKSARSIVSVIVTDNTGKESTEALIFTILSDPNVQPVPPVSSPPSEKSSPKEKMGNRD